MSNESTCSYCKKQCLIPVQLPCQDVLCFLCVKSLILVNNNDCPKCDHEIPSNYLRNIKLVNYDIMYETSDSCCWQYKDNRNSWWMYDERSNAIIEKEYTRNSTTFQMTIGPYIYQIDLTKMRQIRCDNNRLSRAIRRESQRKNDVLGVAGVHFPKIFKNQDMIEYVRTSTIKNTPEKYLALVEEDKTYPKPFIWMFYKNKTWYQMDYNTNQEIEFYYNSFRNKNANSKFKLKFNKEESEIDFTRLTLKSINSNEVFDIKRATSGENSDLSLERLTIKSDDDKNFAGYLNDKLPTENFSENKKGSLRWYFKNKENFWIGLDEKTSKFIEARYSDYLLNGKSKFEIVIDGYNFDMKKQIRFRKDGDTQELQRASNENEAETKFLKRTIDKYLLLSKTNKKFVESWYLLINDTWEKYEDRIGSALEKAYISYLNDDRLSLYENEIDNARNVFDFSQFFVLNCSDMSMKRFCRGNKDK